MSSRLSASLREKRERKERRRKKEKKEEKKSTSKLEYKHAGFYESELFLNLR